MSSIEWQSAYEIGIKTVDEQHQQLVALINQLEGCIYSRDAETISEHVLSKLVDYVRYHFAEEEKLMAENLYDQTDHHAELHQFFIKKVAGFLKKLKTDGSISTQELLSFLKSWLINHILREDTKLRSLNLPIEESK